MTVNQAYKLMMQYRNKMVKASKVYEQSGSHKDRMSYDTTRSVYLYLKERFDELLEEWHEDTQELVVI